MVDLEDLMCCIEDLRLLGKQLDFAKKLPEGKYYNFIEVIREDGKVELPIPREFDTTISKMLVEHFEEENARTVKKFEVLVKQYASEKLN